MNVFVTENILLKRGSTRGQIQFLLFIFKESIVTLYVELEGSFQKQLRFLLKSTSTMALCFSPALDSIEE